MGNTPKIYESPDGGLTVYERDFGADPSTRTPVKQIFKTHPHPLAATWQRVELIEKYPELKAKWEEYIELEQHYIAWDILNKKTVD